MVTIFFVIDHKKNVITLWSQNNFVIVTKKNVIVTRKSVIVTKSLLSPTEKMCHQNLQPPTTTAPLHTCGSTAAAAVTSDQISNSSSSSSSRAATGTATEQQQHTTNSQPTNRPTPTNQHPATRNNLHRSLSLQQSHMNMESAQWVWERVIFLSLPTHTAFFRSNASHHCWWIFTLNCFDLYLHSSNTTRFCLFSIHDSTTTRE